MSFAVEDPLRSGEIAECLSCLHQRPVLCELVSTEHTIGPFSLNLEQGKPAAVTVSLLPVELRLPLCRTCAALLGSELSRRARRACK